MQGEADLYVETETGRPMLLSSTVRKQRRWKVDGREVDGRAIDVSNRRWGFNRKGSYERPSFAADPEISVRGTPRALALGPDDRVAAALLEREAGKETVLWDLAGRKVGASWASTADTVLVDSLGGTPVVYEVTSVSVEGKMALSGQGWQAMGSVMFPSRGFEPTAAASTGAWVAVAAEDGTVAIAEPRVGCFVGNLRSKLQAIKVVALPSRAQIVLADAAGKVEVLKVKPGPAPRTFAPRCGSTVVASPDATFTLPKPAVRADARDGSVLFTAASGEAFLWNGKGQPRPLGNRGVEATLTIGPKGKVDAVTTREGTTALDAELPPKGGQATAPGGGPVAFSASGGFGVSADGGSLDVVVPGQQKPIARLGTTTVGVAGVVAHGRTLVALAEASEVGKPVHLSTWDLSTVTARTLPVQGASEGALVPSIDGARYALATPSSIEVRETASGKVLRAFTRAELGASGRGRDAKLGRAGQSVFVRRSDGSIAVRDIVGGGPSGDLPAGVAASASAFVASPTEDLVLALGANGALTGTELPGRRVRFSVPATKPSGREHVLAASADGAWVAVSDTHREGSSWNPLIPVVEIRSTKDGSLIVSLSPSWASLTSLAFSADKRLLFGGAHLGELLTWDTASGLLLSERRAHQRAITSLFVASNDTLISSSTDGSVRLWNPLAVEDVSRGGALALVEEAVAPLRPTRLAATLVVDARGDAVAATGDGYYKADRGSLRSLELASGTRRYEFQQFDALLHRPDIVLERLRGDGRGVELLRAAAKKREALLRGKLPQNLSNGPKITVTERLPLATSSRAFPLRVRVDAGEASLRAVHVSVSSVPVGSIEGQPITGTSWSGEIPITLGAGANRIEVYATDQRGAVSTIASHVVQLTGPTPPPELYAVVVGVSKYANPKLNLDYAAKDARDVGALLAASKRFAKVNVHEIVDERATRTQILGARLFLERAKVDDTVVVFLAGHGVLDANLDYWFATTDIDPLAPAAAALSYAHLSSLITGLSARRRLVLLDTCHAGEADNAGDSTWIPPSSATAAVPHVKQFRGLELVRRVPPGQSFGLMQQLFTDLRASNGAIVLGSAGGTELAFESATYKNGVFTYALLEALREGRGDADRSGDVSATELVRYVQKRVNELTLGAQRPATRGENLDLDFAIY